MPIARRQTLVNDPNPSVFNWFQAGFGGTSILAMITDPGTDTLSGSILVGYATEAYDGGDTINRIQDPVNGNWTTVDHILNTTAANTDNLSAYFQNAQPLKQVAGTFSADLSAAAKTLTVTTAVTGAVRVGDHITGPGLPANSVIFSIISGTGGIGTVYQMNDQAGFTNQTAQAYSAANATMVVFNLANDYGGAVFHELTGGATSGALVGHAGQNQTLVGTSTDNATSGTAACGSSPAMITGYYFNGGVTSTPYAGTAGTNFSDSAAILSYNIGSPIARWEMYRSPNPGTVAATVTSGGSDEVTTMMMAFAEASAGNPAIMGDQRGAWLVDRYGRRISTF